MWRSRIDISSRAIKERPSSSETAPRELAKQSRSREKQRLLPCRLDVKVSLAVVKTWIRTIRRLGDTGQQGVSEPFGAHSTRVRATPAHGCSSARIVASCSRQRGFKKHFSRSKGCRRRESGTVRVYRVYRASSPRRHSVRSAFGLPSTLQVFAKLLKTSSLLSAMKADTNLYTRNICVE